ncbi:acyltransferase family protein [Simiduia aestuariiviva]|uniref:Peptidoglycan/LPS O-acetylase OafA/YrhL n=1 Tax=Simiduia aestuariiviva TaxID=1510459 RepID=A0A839UPE0_9GAMM|nr:acyltransferase family protein [Simiduia aestuariiviva]MBB3168369.1 peptidoglycan/LPS O-acetylase OafA/YrhL [Simiduia aestuariiviva]
MGNIIFRPDIEGLRGWAVLLVVLYHLGFEALSGGYVGVDVFFVISGYLITGIILKDVDGGQFSFKTFYLRRIRRLLPALVSVILLTLISALFLLDPPEIVALTHSAIAAIFSLSNILFYSESGYWDAASASKPLLHTWSLSVEEQFYLIWPVFLFFFFKAASQLTRALLLGVIVLLGCILSAYMTTLDSSAAFFLTPFRVFQFAFGAFVYQCIQTYPHALELGSFSQSLIRVLSCLVLLYSAITLSDASHYPGWLAIIPTVATGALLLIRGNEISFFERLLFTNRFIRWFGKISYSLYLLHWPVIVFFTYAVLRDMNNNDRLILFVVSVLLAVILNSVVENYFYRRSGLGVFESPRRISLTGFLTASFATFFVLVAINIFYEGRVLSDQVSLTKAMVDEGKRDRYKFSRLACRLSKYPSHKACQNLDGSRVLFMGNSHETDGYNFYRGFVGRDINSEAILFGQTNSCPKIISENGVWRSADKQCQKRLNLLQSESFLKTIDTIVYSANKPFFINKLKFYEFFKQVKAVNSDIKLIVLGGFLNTKYPCSLLVNRFGSAGACFQKEFISYFPYNENRHKLYGGFISLADIYVDKVEIMCEERAPANCINTTSSGQPVFFDSHHLSRSYAELIGATFRSFYTGH